MKVRAKAKVREQSRLAQKELEENLTPLEVRQGESRRINRVKTINTAELKNVIAATVQRVYMDEYGVDIPQGIAREHHAQFIVMALKYGRWNEDGYLQIEGGIKMTDHDYENPPLCKEHQVSHEAA